MSAFEGSPEQAHRAVEAEGAGLRSSGDQPGSKREGRPGQRRAVKTDGALVTIDSASTRDIDDAISVREHDGGGFDVVVCIADPSSRVQRGSTEDENARLLGATVYVRDAAVRRMLPGKISEFEASLIAGEQRKVLVYRAQISPDLSIKEFTVERGLATVTHRLCYEEVPAVLQDQAHECHPVIRAASSLAHGLLQARRGRGAMALYDLARLVFTDEDGRLRQFSRREEVVGHIIVQELMILANTLLGRFMVANGIPGLFRNHVAQPAAPASRDLAATIETWLNTPSLDMGKAEETFRLLVGRAGYGAAVVGHYALAEPVYTHGTSPLRRYADLVNVHQVGAFLKKLPFVWESGELPALAQHLNERAEDRREERSEGFIKAVHRHVERAMDRGSLSHLADHEMSQAVKLAAVAGEVPPLLADELVRRLNANTVTDKITDRMLVELGPKAWPEDVRSAFSQWVMDVPTRANHLLLHGQQSGLVSALEVITRGEDTKFTGNVRVLLSDGREAHFSADGSRKKDAEQLACARAVLWLIGAQEVAVAPAARSERVVGNPKGQLLELCQKRGWPMPDFLTAGKGPSHAMVFECTVHLRTPRGLFDRTVRGAANKKEAEALASLRLLEALGQEPAGGKPAGAGSSGAIGTGGDAGSGSVGVVSGGAAPSVCGNPVGELQEAAQKGKWAPPTYQFEQLSSLPSVFRAKVTVYGPGGGEFAGEGPTKQVAKAAAAQAAIAAQAGA